MGINLVKLLAFAMGNFSGFAGAFYGAYISAIFPSVFDFSVSVIVLCMFGWFGQYLGVLGLHYYHGGGSTLPASASASSKVTEYICVTQHC